MPPVPTTAQVQPGAAVSIVLKADQRTGRQVQGTVQDLLSRGNHPRGIKVRLRDGRVGRVQRMAASLPASATSGAVDASAPALAGEGAYMDDTHGEGMQVRREGSGMQRVRHRDVRLEEEGEAPREELDLAAYIKPARRKKGRKGAEGGGDALEQGHGAEGSAGVTAKCPVCGEFEGDEAAVAHHVEAHFTEAPCG